MAEENNEKLRIRLHVYDTDIPVNVRPEDEPLYRDAASLITQTVNAYASRYKGPKNEKEILYMALIEIALRYQINPAGFCAGCQKVKKAPAAPPPGLGARVGRAQKLSRADHLFSGRGNRIRRVHQLFSQWRVMLPPCCWAAVRRLFRSGSWSGRPSGPSSGGVSV